MYNQNALLVVGVLFALLLVGIELGYRIGHKVQAHFSESARGQINSMRASMLGMLALLLGFTFSQSLQRFDARSEAVVDEANAIGTAYLRAELISPATGEPAQGLLRQYVDLRIQEAAVSLATSEEGLLVEQAEQKHADLWRYARQAVAKDRDPVTSLFVQSINELIDAFGKREAEVNRHVPEIVLFVLFATFVMTGGVVGFASGAEGHRPSITAHVAALVIVLVVFLVIDLDRPRRGLIRVPQRSLLDLQAAVQVDDVGS